MWFKQIKMSAVLWTTLFSISTPAPAAPPPPGPEKVLELLQKIFDTETRVPDRRKALNELPGALIEASLGEQNSATLTAHIETNLRLYTAGVEPLAEVINDFIKEKLKNERSKQPRPFMEEPAVAHALESLALLSHASSQTFHKVRHLVGNPSFIELLLQSDNLRLHRAAFNLLETCAQKNGTNGFSRDAIDAIATLRYRFTSLERINPRAVNPVAIARADEILKTKIGHHPSALWLLLEGAVDDNLSLVERHDLLNQLARQVLETTQRNPDELRNEYRILRSRYDNAVGRFAGMIGIWLNHPDRQQTESDANRTVVTTEEYLAQVLGIIRRFGNHHISLDLGMKAVGRDYAVQLISARHDEAVVSETLDLLADGGNLPGEQGQSTRLACQRTAWSIFTGHWPQLTANDRLNNANAKFRERLIYFFEQLLHWGVQMEAEPPMREALGVRPQDWGVYRDRLRAEYKRFHEVVIQKNLLAPYTEIDSVTGDSEGTNGHEVRARRSTQPFRTATERRQAAHTLVWCTQHLEALNQLLGKTVEPLLTKSLANLAAPTGILAALNSQATEVKEKSRGMRPPDGITYRHTLIYLLRAIAFNPVCGDAAQQLREQFYQQFLASQGPGSSSIEWLFMYSNSADAVAAMGLLRALATSPQVEALIREEAAMRLIWHAENSTFFDKFDPASAKHTSHTQTINTAVTCLITATQMVLGLSPDAADLKPTATNGVNGSSNGSPGAHSLSSETLAEMLARKGLTGEMLSRLQGTLVDRLQKLGTMQIRGVQRDLLAQARQTTAGASSLTIRSREGGATPPATPLPPTQLIPQPAATPAVVTPAPATAPAVSSEQPPTPEIPAPSPRTQETLDLKTLLAKALERTSPLLEREKAITTLLALSEEHLPLCANPENRTVIQDNMPAFAALINDPTLTFVARTHVANTIAGWSLLTKANRKYLEATPPVQPIAIMSGLASLLANNVAGFAKANDFTPPGAAALRFWSNNLQIMIGSALAYPTLRPIAASSIQTTLSLVSDLLPDVGFFSDGQGHATLTPNPLADGAKRQSQALMAVLWIYVNRGGILSFLGELENWKEPATAADLEKLNLRNVDGSPVDVKEFFKIYRAIQTTTRKPTEYLVRFAVQTVEFMFSDNLERNLAAKVMANPTAYAPELRATAILYWRYGYEKRASDMIGSEETRKLQRWQKYYGMLLDSPWTEQAILKPHAADSHEAAAMITNMLLDEDNPNFAKAHDWLSRFLEKNANYVVQTITGNSEDNYDFRLDLFRSLLSAAQGSHTNARLRQQGIELLAQIYLSSGGPELTKDFTEECTRAPAEVLERVADYAAQKKSTGDLRTQLPSRLEEAGKLDPAVLSMARIANSSESLEENYLKTIDILVDHPEKLAAGLQSGETLQPQELLDLVTVIRRGMLFGSMDKTSVTSADIVAAHWITRGRFFTVLDSLNERSEANMGEEDDLGKIRLTQIEMLRLMEHVAQDPLAEERFGEAAARVAREGLEIWHRSPVIEKLQLTLELDRGALIQEFQARLQDLQALVRVGEERRITDEIYYQQLQDFAVRETLRMLGHSALIGDSSVYFNRIAEIVPRSPMLREFPFSGQNLGHLFATEKMVTLSGNLRKNKPLKASERSFVHRPIADDSTRGATIRTGAEFIRVIGGKRPGLAAEFPKTLSDFKDRLKIYNPSRGVR